MSIAVRTLQIGTDVVGTTYSFGTTLPFVPKAAIGILSGAASATDAIVANLDNRPCIGLATSATDRRCQFGQDDDAALTSAVDRYGHDAAFVAILDVTGALAGLLDIQSFDSNNITFIVDQQFTAVTQMLVIVIGGSVTAEGFQVQQPVATGNFDVTSLSFDPTPGAGEDSILFLASAHINAPAPPAGGTGLALSFGAAISATEQAVAAIRIGDNQATMSCDSYAIDGVECSANITSASNITTRLAWVSWLSNGVRLNKLDGSVQPYIIGLIVKGGQWAIKSGLTQTDTSTDIVLTGCGFAPEGGITVSTGRAESTQDTPTPHALLSIGAFESATVRGAQSISQQNGALTADCVVAIEYDAVLVLDDETAAGAQVRAIMDVKTMDADGVTHIMDDADSAQSFFFDVLHGPAAAGANAPSKQRYYRNRRAA